MTNFVMQTYTVLFCEPIEEESFLQLFTETQAALQEHPRTISLLNADPYNGGQNAAKARYNALRTLRRSAQRELVALSRSAIAERAGAIVHGAGISQAQLQGLRRATTAGPHGQLLRSSLGVSIATNLPSSAQVRASDEAAIAEGRVQRLRTIHEADLTWAYEALKDGMLSFRFFFFFFFFFFQK